MKTDFINRFISDSTSPKRTDWDTHKRGKQKGGEIKLQHDYDEKQANFQLTPAR